MAIPENNEDDILFEHLKNSKIPCFRGSSLDVLDRFYHCAKAFSFKHIMRITGDNPLIDPDVVDKAIKEYNKEEGINIEIRQNKYLNNLVEQDHRSIKHLCRATLGFQSFRTAKITLSGFECMKILNKKHPFSGGKSPARHFCVLIK